MTNPDAAWPVPSPFLLLRRGWYDPFLYLVAAAISLLAYMAGDNERNLQLEEAIGYTAGRLAFIAALAAFVWGTIQGLRGRLVVFIDDRTTPRKSDALLTAFCMVGIPLLVFALVVLAYVATAILAPAGFREPRYEEAGFLLVGIAWTGALAWMYARLYAYNPGALSACVALVTRLAWCLFALHFLNQAEHKLTNADNESFGDAAYGFLVSLVLFWLAVVVIDRLTYAGPSLRVAGSGRARRERQPEID